MVYGFIIPTANADNQIVMTADQFINCLKKALARNTSYNNKYPYNLGYYDGNTISWDCWNLGKSILWSRGTIVDNYTPGNHASIDTSIGLGDWDGLTIIQKAPNCGSDFSNLVPGEWLYMDGHTGYYIGNGQVIECTAGWNAWCVVQSQIDSSGHRSKDGVDGGYWLYHGMVPWIQYQYHSHDTAYTSKGQCGNCGAWNTNYTYLDFTPGIYKADTSPVYLRVHPYAISDTAHGEPAVSLSSGERVTVTGAINNCLGHKWYSVTYNGRSGYITADKLTFVESAVVVNFEPWEEAGKTYIYDTDASVGSTITVSGGTCTDAGMYLYYAGGSLLATVSNGRYDSSEPHIYFKINEECHRVLSPGTTYRYRFFAMVNGKTYQGPEYTFTTTGASYYTLDVSGLLDGSAGSDTSGYGTFDVWLDGVLVYNDATRYSAQVPSGSFFELKDIRPRSGKEYLGVSSGSRTGTMNGNVNTVLSFGTISPLPDAEPVTACLDGHMYWYYSVPATWYAARQYCRELGGHLATVNSPDEHVLLVSISDPNPCWLGGTDSSSEGTWTWVTGEPFTYSDWCDGQPDDYAGAHEDGEDFMHLHTDGRFNDNASCALLSFICEFDSYEASVSLNRTSLSISDGSSYTLTASVIPNGAVSAPFSWTSSDPSVAAVSPDGKVTAVTPGTAVITASCGDLSASCTVTVSSPLTVSVRGSELSWRMFSSRRGRARLVAAWYDSSGRLLGASASEETLSHMSRGTLEVDEGAYEYRLFVLDRDDSPVCSFWTSLGK